MAGRSVDVIVAATTRGGIGRAGALPWHLPADMSFFKELTTRTEAPGARNAVIMGRKTWASIPEKFRPLKGRVNVVLSRSADVRATERIPDDVLVSPSLEAAVTLLSNPPHGADVENIFVIGGAAAFEEAMGGRGPVLCRTIYLTRVHTLVECDVFITPVDDARFALADFKVRTGGLAATPVPVARTIVFLPPLAQPRQSENGVEFQFCTYQNRAAFHLERGIRPGPVGSAASAHEEYQYLDAIRWALPARPPWEPTPPDSLQCAAETSSARACRVKTARASGPSASLGCRYARQTASGLASAAYSLLFDPTTADALHPPQRGVPAADDKARLLAWRGGGAVVVHLGWVGS